MPKGIFTYLIAFAQPNSIQQKDSDSITGCVFNYIKSGTDLYPIRFLYPMYVMYGIAGVSQ